MYYVEYNKNGSKLIFSEKDGYLSHFAGSYELEVLSNQKKCHQPLRPVQETNSKDLYISMASQAKRKSRTRQKQVDIMGDSH